MRGGAEEGGRERRAVERGHDRGGRAEESEPLQRSFGRRYAITNEITQSQRNGMR